MRPCLTLAVATASLVSHVAGDNAFLSRRHLADENRHSDVLSYKNVDLSKTYTRRSSRGVFCSPDSDGYFGSTLGFNVPVEFAFAVEYAPDADINAIFYQIDLLVEDTLLGGFFPKDCKYSTKQALKSRNLSTRSITGFRFITGFQEMAAVNCDAKLANATCEIYEGVLSVYGAVDLLDEANVKLVYEALQVAFDEEIGTNIHEKLFDIYWVDAQSVEKLTEPASPGDTHTSTTSNTVGTGSAARKSGMDSIAILGIVISLIALIIGFGGMVYVEKRRRQGQTEEISKHDEATSNEVDAPSCGLDNDTPNFVMNEH